MGYYPFDSRNNLYIDKIGALASGETLTLRLLLHRDACVHDAFVVIERDGETPYEISLVPAGWLEDYRFYEAEIRLGEGLYFYHFRYTSNYGEFYVSKTETSLGIVSGDIVKWQKTVFDEGYTTPDWLAGGLIYQIFPDRFYYSGTEKANVPEDRFLCKGSDKEPEYRQNNGECSLGNDYYCGDLKGIEQKLPYLKELGVTCIYLNPVFEAHSNHRYNTADYMKIDPLLGTEQDFVSLCKAAKKKNIAIILDGVFSHTGDDSIYFNKYRRYGDGGAYNNRCCEYAKWFNFNNGDLGYAAWWGVPSLPETNENNPSYCEFITGENGVIKHWLKLGAKGFRLDVADELPDDFLDMVRKAIKSHSEDNYLLGEVWEDASSKISYGARRRFLRGRQLDSVMNYPFCNAIIDFVCKGDAKNLNLTVLNILENYPKQSVKLLMNHIGTHDTLRILTALGTYGEYIGDRAWQSGRRLSRESYKAAVKLLKAAAVIQYTLPGVPSLYYGDEAGMEGYGDPFCRGMYPWGNEDNELLSFYKQLGSFRAKTDAFKGADYIPIAAEEGFIAFMRSERASTVFTAVNVSGDEKAIDLPKALADTQITVFGTQPENSKIILKPYEYSVIKNK